MKQKYAIIALVITALMTACNNPFVREILPDDKNTPGNVKVPDPTFTINITITGGESGDSVTAAPAKGKAGDKITLSYALARTKTNNRLVFSGTKAAIAQESRAGVDNTPVTGSREYIINAEDASAGKVITIIADFTHTNKTTDTIAFADTSNVNKTYGDEPFTKAISTTGSGSGTITYSSSDETVATVDSAGTVTILKVGTATITATKAEDATYAEAKASYILTVAKATGRTVSAPVMASKTKTSITVTAVTVQTPNFGQIAEYAIATASSPAPTAAWQEGLTFSGLTAGTTYYVFARSKENENCTAGEAQVSAAIKTPDITITIVPSGNVQGDSVTASPAEGLVGEEITIDYTLAKTKINNLITFSGTNPAIAQVPSAGSGTRKYTINASDAAEKVITINATFTHTDKTPDTIAFENTSNVEKIYGLDDNSNSFERAIITTGSGSGAISYRSSDQTVATVNSSTGAVTILKVGTTTITATKAEDVTHAAATASYTLTVERRPVTITGLSAANKVYNGTTAATLSGTAAIDGKLSADVLTVNNGTAAFADKNVGNGKTVTFSGYSLGGAAMGNYILSAQPASVTADITALQLTGNESVTTTRAYDGTTTAAVSFTNSNKISTDTLTIDVTGAYNEATAAGAHTISVVYTLSGADKDNYIKPADHTVSGTISKATGRTVTALTAAFRTHDSIRVNAVSIEQPAALGQSAEYAISLTNALPASGWNTTLSFTGLAAKTTYYVFARANGNTANVGVGDAKSVEIKTITNDTDRMTVITFESDNIGKTYESTRGGSSPTVKVASDPANSSQKSLEINVGGYNQAPVIPVNLPYALSNYELVSFRFRLASGNPGTDLADKSIMLYAAQDSTRFTSAQYQFGNDNASFRDNLLGKTTAETFGDKHQGEWTDFTITINPGNTIQNIQGTIYIAIGINCQSMNFLLDDIKFVLKDSFVPPASISPASGAFDKDDPKNITVNMALQGNTLTSITNTTGSPATPSTTLTSGTDYTVNNTTNVVTLNTSYLEKLAVGTATLNFNFSGGDPATRPFTITVTDSQATISPATGSFIKANPADIKVTISSLGNKTFTITNTTGDPETPPTLTSGTDYTVNNTTNEVTLKTSYLTEQPVGDTTLTFNFSRGGTLISTKTFTVKIAETIVVPPTWYNFVGGDTLPDDYPKYYNNSTNLTVSIGPSAATTGTVQGKTVLKVVKTTSNNGTPRFILPFTLDTGKNLSNYSGIVLMVQGISGGVTNKTMAARVGDTATTIGLTEGNAFHFGSTPLVKAIFIPITLATANTYTGTVDIGFELTDNIGTINYEILCMGLVPSIPFEQNFATTDVTYLNNSTANLSVTSDTSTATSGALMGRTVLKVVKTTSSNNPRFILPFTLDTGKNLSNYSGVILLVRAVSGSVTNMTMVARDDTTATSFGQTEGTQGFHFSGTLPIVKPVYIPFNASATSSGPTVNIGFEFSSNSSAANYEIVSIGLVPLF